MLLKTFIVAIVLLVSLEIEVNVKRIDEVSALE